MLAPLADLGAVAALLPGNVVPAESEVFVSALLDGASDLVRAQFGGIDDRIAADNPSGEAVSRVVAAMVKRAFLDPGIVESQTAGPFGMKFRDDALYLRSYERAILAGVGTVASSGARSVRMGY